MKHIFTTLLTSIFFIFTAFEHSSLAKPKFVTSTKNPLAWYNLEPTSIIIENHISTQEISALPSNTGPQSKLAQLEIAGERAKFIYQKLKDSHWHHQLFTYGFSIYHSVAFLENSHHLLKGTSLFRTAFGSKLQGASDPKASRYIARLNLIKDVYSLSKHLVFGFFNAPSQALEHYTSFRGSDALNDEIMEDYLWRAKDEHAYQRSFRAHFLRLGFNSLFAMLIAFDLGNTSAAWKYFFSGFIGAEIKAYIGPHYAPGIWDEYTKHFHGPLKERNDISENYTLTPYLRLAVTPLYGMVSYHF